MVDFQESDSQFYVANKNFIEEILFGLNGFQFQGWCNAYGYDVEGRRQNDTLNFTVIFKKHQTTQNGIFIPLNAHVNSESLFVVNGINSEVKFRIGKNWFLHLIHWQSKDLKNNKSLTQDQIEAVNSFMKMNQFNKMSIKKGELLLKMDNSTQNPIELFHNLENLLLLF